MQLLVDVGGIPFSSYLRFDHVRLEIVYRRPESQLLTVYVANSSIRVFDSLYYSSSSGFNTRSSMELSTGSLTMTTFLAGRYLRSVAAIRWQGFRRFLFRLVSWC